MSEWEAMETLMAAHAVGQAQMDELERAAESLEESRTTEALKSFELALEFAECELKRHFDHEERALFPVLARIIGRGGPIGAMEGEHESLWRCVDDFVETLATFKAEGGAPSSDTRRNLARQARHVVWSLRGHIKREDSMLFPLAEKILDERGKREVDANVRTVNWLASREVFGR